MRHCVCDMVTRSWRYLVAAHLCYVEWC